jgi:hypothetical protein
VADVRRLKKQAAPNEDKGESASGSAASAPSDPSRVSVKRRVRRTLTTEKFKPPQEFSAYTVLIYGEPKVGKTTLVSQFPKTDAFMFEPNDSYELYKEDILAWEDFLELQEEFLAGDHDFLSVSIDTVQPAYELAMAYAGKRFGFDHPGGQDDYGQSWDKVRKTFVAPMLQLMNSRYGVIGVAHQVDKENNKKSGGSFTKIRPAMSTQAESLWVGKVYNVFYYYYEGGERWLQIVGDEMVTAGNRMKGHFLTTEGERVFRIPMGDDEEEGYHNLIAAFDNKQKEAYQPAKRETLKRKLKK